MLKEIGKYGIAGVPVCKTKEHNICEVFKLKSRTENKTPHYGIIIGGVPEEYLEQTV